jgi:hypothetical protein
VAIQNEIIPKTAVAAAKRQPLSWPGLTGHDNARVVHPERGDIKTQGALFLRKFSDAS